MPSVTSVRDAARSSHTLQLPEVPLRRAGTCRDHHSAGGELVWARFRSLVQFALAGLGFETQKSFPTNIRSQNRPSSLDSLFPIMGDSSKHLLTNTIIPAARGRRRMSRWGTKRVIADVSEQWFVCRCGISAGEPNSFSCCRRFSWYLKSGLLDFAIKKELLKFIHRV